ncbi:MAG: hypothetical protein JNJ57_15095 [Saprospiraceae bacterium]|nr:hypothetical protein [Saprospiraceae bacterium]
MLFTHPSIRYYCGAFIFLLSACVQKSSAQQGIKFQPNPDPDHYFFAPSGLRAETGKRNFNNTSLIFFHSNQSKSNGRSVGWGLVPTFVTGQTNDIPIWITAAKRWQTGNPNINPWLGGVFLKLADDSENDGWIFNSGVTFGTKEKHVSAGGFIGSFDKHAAPFKGFMLNGQVRLWTHSWLICENYLALRQGSLTPICLWGFRKKMRKISMELGGGWTKISAYQPETGFSESQYVPFPWVSIVIGLPKKPELPNFDPSP